MHLFILTLLCGLIGISTLNARHHKDAFRTFEDEIALEEAIEDETAESEIFEEGRISEMDLYNTNNDFFRNSHHRHQSHHSFASAFSDTSQVIPVDILTTVLCPVNQSHTPQRIIHPLNGDSSAFKIGPSGIYEISWSLILSNPNSDTATVEILANGVALQPTQTETLDTSGQRTVSGTIIVFLESGTILQLAVISTAGDLVVNSPIFTICDK